jgi:D-3-phosphoglycerate dehydrogenase
MKKVLITSRSFGKIGDSAKNILLDAGIEIVNKSVGFDQKEFEAIIPEYDALIIGAHDFSEADMERCPNLKIICKHGVGLDNIHLDKAKELGIAVCNAPGTNSNAVADLTLGLMLSVARKIDHSADLVRKGVWKSHIGEDVYGKTLGLLGFGAIAKKVAKRAWGFDMRVLAYDPFVKELPEEFSSYVKLCSFDEVISSCDFLSVHMPLTEETRNIVSTGALNKMKLGAYVINTARGGIVDESALYESLVSGHLHGAAMDVVEHEPMTAEHPLLSLPNVTVTPHIGMYSKEAINAVSEICARNVVAALCGGELINKVV